MRAESFEQPADRRASELLPAELIEGTHHRVAEHVVSYGYMHEWSVESDFGTFHATGDGALRKLIGEIYAIAALKDVSSSEAFAQSVKAAAKSPFQFGLKMITDPVDTASAVPGGVFRIFENVGEAATSAADPSEDSSLEQAASVSTWKRDFAAQTGVDVYSSNTVLQEELNRIGWAAAIGGLAVSAATMPLGGPVALVFRQTRFANQLTDVMKDEPPARLRIINGETLAGAGVEAGLVERYLDHPSYSPRHDTVIALSLAALGQATGRDAFLTVALSAQDEAEANFFMNAAQLMRAYAETQGPIQEVRIDGRLSVAVAENGTVFLPVPVDHVLWTARAQQVLDGLAAAGGGAQAGLVIWTTGDASEQARAEFGSRGITLVENVDETMDIVD